VELSPDAWRKLHEVSTASLTSELLKLGFRNTFMAGIRPLRPDQRMVGYAFTLRYVPAREDLDFQVEYDNWTNPQRVAVETVGPDQVLVIDARGQLGAALRRGRPRHHQLGAAPPGRLRSAHRLRRSPG
jgi:regulator of RNase E activity RraA